MKVDIFDLSEASNHESRLISIYNIIEIVFDLENSLAYDNFAIYWQIINFLSIVNKMRLKLFINTELLFSFIRIIDYLVVYKWFYLNNLLSYIYFILSLELILYLQKFDITCDSALLL